MASEEDYSDVDSSMGFFGSVVIFDPSYDRIVQAIAFEE
jgi:hypothetical protein